MINHRNCKKVQQKTFIFVTKISNLDLRNRMNSNFKLIIFNVVWLIILTVYSLNSINIIIRDYTQATNKTLFQQKYAHYNQNKYNIFFIETNTQRNEFDPRQLCAIESAAYNNPKAIVYVYSIRAKINESLLQAYSNIKHVILSFENVFKNTVFEDWFKTNNKRLFNSPFFYEHASDLLRIVLLWKYGGYYSDLDTITIKNIEPLLRFNGAALQNEKPVEINNANLIFKKNHSFLYDLMDQMARDYNPYGWTVNGQYKIEKTAYKYCNLTKLDSLILSKDSFVNKIKNKCDFHLFPKNYFAPLKWYKWQNYFKFNQRLEVSKFLHAYSIHFYSKLSKHSEIYIGSNSIYEFYAKSNCPIFYENFLTKIAPPQESIVENLVNLIKSFF